MRLGFRRGQLGEYATCTGVEMRQIEDYLTVWFSLFKEPVNACLACFGLLTWFCFGFFSTWHHSLFLQQLWSLWRSPGFDVNQLFIGFWIRHSIFNSLINFVFDQYFLPLNRNFALFVKFFCVHDLVAVIACIELCGALISALKLTFDLLLARSRE